METKTLKKIAKGMTLFLCLSNTPFAGFAQANNWLLQNGDGSSAHNYSLSCNNAPSSTNPGSISVNPVAGAFANSAYDDAGNLLFSVNASGIYSYDGSLAEDNWLLTNQPSIPPSYSFSQSGPYSTSTFVFENWVNTTFSALNLGWTPENNNAESEILIFPIRNKCGHYYVMFWSQDPANLIKHYLRLVEVSTSYNSPTIVLSDIVLYSQTTPSDWYYYFGIVADQEDANGNRVIYTLDPYAAPPQTTSPNH